MIRSRPASWNEKPSTMSTDQNLLFGVIALQMDLLEQYVLDSLKARWY